MGDCSEERLTVSKAWGSQMRGYFNFRQTTDTFLYNYVPNITCDMRILKTGCLSESQVELGILCFNLLNWVEGYMDEWGLFSQWSPRPGLTLQSKWLSSWEDD